MVPEDDDDVSGFLWAS